jgi:hypothetical protein
MNTINSAGKTNTDPRLPAASGSQSAVYGSNMKNWSVTRKIRAPHMAGAPLGCDSNCGFAPGSK